MTDAELATQLRPLVPLLPHIIAAVRAQLKREAEAARAATFAADSDDAPFFKPAFTADQFALYSRYFGTDTPGQYPFTMHRHFGLSWREFADRTGLVRTQITDKNGRDVWRWVKPADAQTAPQQAPAQASPNQQQPAGAQPNQGVEAVGKEIAAELARDPEIAANPSLGAKVADLALAAAAKAYKVALDITTSKWTARLGALLSEVFDVPSDLAKLGYNPNTSSGTANPRVLDPVSNAIAGATGVGISGHLVASIASKVIVKALFWLRDKLKGASQQHADEGDWKAGVSDLLADLFDAANESVGLPKVDRAGVRAALEGVGGQTFAGEPGSNPPFPGAIYNPNDHHYHKPGEPGAGGSAPSSKEPAANTGPQPTEVITQTRARLGPKLAAKVASRPLSEGGEIVLDREEVDAILKHGVVGFISAGKNPNDAEDSKLDDEAITARYKELRGELEARGYVFVPVRGHYGGQEDSFLVMVPEANKDDMVELGKRFKQDSVIVSEAGKNHMVFTTGPHAGKEHAGEGFDYRPDAADYYSEYCPPGKHDANQCVKFSLNFDFDKHVPKGFAAPGPPPRPGLQWKEETHRWIHPETGAEVPHEPAAAPPTTAPVAGPSLRDQLAAGPIDPESVIGVKDRPVPPKKPTTKGTAAAIKYRDNARRLRVVRAVNNEGELAKAIGGHNLPDSEPADVVHIVGGDGKAITDPAAIRQLLKDRELGIRWQQNPPPELIDPESKPEYLATLTPATRAQLLAHYKEDLAERERVKAALEAKCHFIEVKTLLTAAKGAVHINKKAMARKEKWWDRYGISFSVVVFDDRRGSKHSGHRVYALPHTMGGTMRLENMQKAGSLEDVLKLLAA